MYTAPMMIGHIIVDVKYIISLIVDVTFRALKPIFRKMQGGMSPWALTTYCSALISNVAVVGLKGEGGVLKHIP